jgi:phosphate transport system permease protein
MTDSTMVAAPYAASAARVRRRRRLDIVLRGVGILSLAIAGLMLALLVGSLIATGYPAFTQTHLTLDYRVDAERVPSDDPFKGDFRAIVREALAERFPDATDRTAQKAVNGMLTNNAQYILRDHIVANPGLIGTTVSLPIPMSDPFDQLAKGLVDRTTPEENRRVTDADIARFDQLVAEGRVTSPFNWALFRNADSRFPELAGLAGALWGSFYALLICFLISFPAGIAAGVYLEEFAPKNRFTDIIEVNINNLAAVPSVVFGLLALAVFIGWLGMPRSAPLVGGITLSLMTLPTIIIAARAALKAVPPSIREAALGIGASKHQVVLSHVLPLAMPGILTGSIIGLAQALGETAPLLLIGMNAFVTATPESILAPSTALPTQIFIWADSPERGFVSRTSAAILVLLMFLIVMNGAAVFLRKRFERRW